MLDFFRTTVYEPIYNGLIFFITHLPWADLGIVIILFTIFVRLLILPLSLSAIRTQQQTKLIEPELKALREKYKNDRQKQALAMMDLYRQNNIKPFSGFLTLLIQLPIIIGLYYVFLRSGLPAVNTELLYSFITPPASVDVVFLGLVDVTEKSFVLAFIAAIVQFIQTSLAIPVLPPKAQATGTGMDSEAMKQEFMRAMALQMKYVLPVLIFFVAYNFSAAIAIYLITGGVFHILQELYVKKHIRKPEDKNVTVKSSENVSTTQ